MQCYVPKRPALGSFFHITRLTLPLGHTMRQLPRPAPLAADVGFVFSSGQIGDLAPGSLPSESFVLLYLPQFGSKLKFAE